MRRVEAAGWKAVPTGIEHGTVTVVIDGHPFEVTTLRQDVETFGRKARVDVRPRLARRRRAARLHHQRALGIAPTERSSIMSAGSTTLRRAACASSAIRSSGSPKTICVSCASSAFTPISREGAPDARRPACLHQGARRARDAVARARAHGIAEAVCRAARGADARGDGRERPARHRARRRAVCRELREAWPKVEAALAARPIRCAGSARSASWCAEDAERLCTAAAAVQRRIRATRRAGTAGGASRRR